jgi:ketosteroid isomerase-like protein
MPHRPFDSPDPAELATGNKRQAGDASPDASTTPDEPADRGEQDPLDLHGTVRAIAQAWEEGDWRAACAHFDADAVTMGPDGRADPGGPAACGEAYRAFRDAVVLDRFALTGFDIHAAGDTAVADGSFEMAYVMAGECRVETGRDILVLHRRRERWRVVWRTLITD